MKRPEREHDHTPHCGDTKRNVYNLDQEREKTKDEFVRSYFVNTEKTTSSVNILTCIFEVSSSHLCLDAGYSD
jgi:hypothetical protein